MLQAQTASARLRRKSSIAPDRPGTRIPAILIARQWRQSQRSIIWPGQFQNRGVCDFIGM